MVGFGIKQGGLSQNHLESASTQPGTDQNEQGHCSEPQSTSSDKSDNDNGVSLATSSKEQDTLPSFGNVCSVALASYQAPCCWWFLQSLMKCRFLLAAELAHLNQPALKG